MKLIDLSLTIEEGMVRFPVHWHPMVEISKMGSLHYEKRETHKITLGTHTGTHMDAPRHFIPGGETIDNIPLETLYGNCLVVDFSHLSPNYEVSRDELKSAIKGRDVTRLLLRFNNHKKIDSLKYYQEHAFLSNDAAHFLVENGIKLLAMDTPMPDNPKNGKDSGNDSPIHHILLGSGCVLLEYLNNTDKITKEEIIICAFPLKIKDADGAPVRCVAIEV